MSEQPAVDEQPATRTPTPVLAAAYLCVLPALWGLSRGLAILAADQSPLVAAVAFGGGLLSLYAVIALSRWWRRDRPAAIVGVSLVTLASGIWFLLVAAMIVALLVVPQSSRAWFAR